jgi:hypothetical protein
VKVIQVLSGMAIFLAGLEVGLIFALKVRHSTGRGRGRLCPVQYRHADIVESAR